MTSKILELNVGLLAALRNLSVETLVSDIVNDLLKALGKLLEVFLIKEDLVFIISIAAVRIGPALTFSNGHIEVLVVLGGLDIEEVCTFSSSHRLGIYIVPFTAFEPGLVEIISVLKNNLLNFVLRRKITILVLQN